MNSYSRLNWLYFKNAFLQSLISLQLNSIIVWSISLNLSIESYQIISIIQPNHLINFTSLFDNFTINLLRFNWTYQSNNINNNLTQLLNQL